MYKVKLGGDNIYMEHMVWWCHLIYLHVITEHAVSQLHKTKMYIFEHVHFITCEHL